MADESIIPYNIANLIVEFDIKGNISDVQCVDTFGLNKSFRLFNNDVASPDYFLQRIDHLAFRNIPGMMENIMRITTHVQDGALHNANCLSFLSFAKLHDGSLYHKDHDGNYWRMFVCEDGDKITGITNKTALANETGKAFGMFLKEFAGMEATQLHDTVIGLHDTEYKLGYLEDAFNNNIAGRAASIQPEYDFINDRGDTMCGILYLGKAGHLPLRVVHNNAGPYNLLQNRDSKAVVITNLDTVMAGYTAYDFGHAFMEIAIADINDDSSNAPNIDVALFDALTKSYLQQAGNVLQPMEIQSLMFGVSMMPYLRAVRYLNDYLNGDISYSINYPDQNLSRVRYYINLIKNIETVQVELKLIIDKYADEYVSSMQV